MKWERIFLAVLSLAFATAFYLLLPFERSKYRVALQEEIFYPNGFSYCKMDLDGDGNVEIIRCKEDVSVPAIVIQKADYEGLTQKNLKGEWILEAETCFTDADHDGYKEINAFTWSEDSLWVHVIEPMDEAGAEWHIPLMRLEKYRGEQDWTFYFCDRDTALYFTVFAGHSKYPRKLVRLNPVAGSFRIQEEVFGNNIQKPLFIDLDEDGEMEITGISFAPLNFGKQEIRYSDSCAWLMIYDSELELKAEPVAYQGKPSYVRVANLPDGENQQLLVHYFTMREGQPLHRLEIWDMVAGKLVKIKEKEYDSPLRLKMLMADQKREDGFYLSGEGFLYRINHDLERELVPGTEKILSVESYYPVDLGFDGLYEHVFIDSRGQLQIYRADFKHQVSIDLGIAENQPVFSLVPGKEGTMINVIRRHLFQKLEYSKNPAYPFRYAFLLLLFLLNYSLFFLLLRFQKRYLNKRKETERQLLHYQMANVRQQLEPHFLFNAMNSISGYYRKGEGRQAQHYLVKLSRLMLASIDNSEKMAILLEEEIRFVDNYLQVESMRMGDRLEYEIDVAKQYYKGLFIPKMLIQNFVENALKHGLRPLTERKGRLRIFSVSEHDHIQIVIEDNGIGRSKARENGSRGSGNGLRMISKTLDIFDKLEKVRIGYEIEDLYKEDGRIPAGTKVRIRIPNR